MSALHLSRRHLASLAIPFLPISLHLENDQTQQQGQHPTQEWEEILTPFLESEFWNERDIYDAGHLLMVPLYLANDDSAPTSWMQDFDIAISRFISQQTDPLSSLSTNRVALTQFVYFLSEYALLRNDRTNSDPLSESILDFVQEFWALTEAWQWERDPFPNMRERLTWKLSNPQVDASYHVAIIDEELFLLATAANLAHMGYRESSPSVDEAVTLAEQILRQHWTLNEDGGAIFQPGTWSDERDYRYAGYSEPTEEMEPSSIPGISSDTSHAHRWPKWLHSYIRSADGDDIRSELRTIQASLSTQFYDVVLVPPTRDFPSFRTTNYLDGRNGLYRWNYSELEDNSGYLPWQLSGTLTLGWWSFLPDERTAEFYREFTELFPLPENVIQTYAGPDTARDRYPKFVWPDFFSNGAAEFFVELAARNAERHL